MTVVYLLALALALIARGNATRFHGESTLQPRVTRQEGGGGVAPSGDASSRTCPAQGAALGRTRAQSRPRADATTGSDAREAATHPPSGTAQRDPRGAVHASHHAPTRLQSGRDASGTRTPENGPAQRATKADWLGKRKAFLRAICAVSTGHGKGKSQRGGATGMWARFRRKLVHMKGVSRSVVNPRTRRAVHRLGLWAGGLSTRGRAALTLLPILTACSMPAIERDDVTQRWRDREAAIWAKGYSYDRR